MVPRPERMLLSPEAEDNENSIHTEIDYLVKDPKHEHEKPYEIRYDTGGLIPERSSGYYHAGGSLQFSTTSKPRELQYVRVYVGEG
jgi:hypothetical protein